MMRRAAILLGLFSAAAAQDSLSENVLTDMKAATVFVRVSAKNGVLGYTGSGFLIRKEEGVGWIITNSHVVTAPDLPGALVHVVLDSGETTERVLPAKIAANDPTRDLAVLRVEAKVLPKPIEMSSRVKPKETDTVYSFGFPLGEALSLDGKNPSITVGKATVSSLRTGPSGEVVAVQIDGNINPGNSGGPLVDPSGRLVGVATAKIGGTQIGFAVPPHEIESLFLGQMVGVTLRAVENSGGTVKIAVTVDLADPFRKCKTLTFLVVPRAKVKPPGKPAADGLPRALEGDVQGFPLKNNGDTATGDILLQGPLNTIVDYVDQVRLVRADGKTLYSEPGDLSINFTPVTAPPAPARPEPKIAVQPPKPRKLEEDKDDWLDDRRKRPPVDSLKSSSPAASLAGERKAYGEAQATYLKVSPENLLPCAVWSPTGDAFYLLEGSGLLRKVSFPELKEEQQLRTQRGCAWMCRSKEGLLVLSSESQEIWVIDEAALSVKRKFFVGPLRQIAASPTGSTAVGVLDRGDLAILDVAAGKIVKEWTWSDLWQKLGGVRVRTHPRGGVSGNIGTCAMTPDGTFVFLTIQGSLHRLRLQGTELVYEEVGPGLAQGGRIEISADSKWVAAVRQGGNNYLEDQPRPPGPVTYVFPVDDLQKPALTLPVSFELRALSMDCSAGKWITSTAMRVLAEIGSDGTKAREFPGSDAWGAPLQILLSPKGGNAIVLGEKQIVYLERSK